MSALLLVGSNASLRIDDRKGRSRRFFQQGLLLSAALHLSLLFAFLSLTNHGGDDLVLTYQKTTEIFRQPPSILTPPPRVIQPPVAGHTSGPGIIRPVPNVPETNIPIDWPSTDQPSVSTTASPGDAPPSTSSSAGTANTNIDQDRIYRVDEVEVKPVPIDSPTPAYPAYPRDAGITGVVNAKVLVRPDGSVGMVEVRGSRLFLDITQETLYRWRFKPARMGDRPVAVWVEIPVRFEL